MRRADKILVSGVWNAFITADRIEKAYIDGFKVKRYNRKLGILDLELRNAFLNQGLNNIADRAFGLGGTAIGFILLSSDNTAVTAASTTMGGTVSGKAASPAFSRSGQTVTGGATWTQADLAFSVRKIGTSIAATDSVGNVQNIIGGAGSAPYNKQFTLDLTTVGNFSQTLQNAITFAAV